MRVTVVGLSTVLLSLSGSAALATAPDNQPEVRVVAESSYATVTDDGTWMRVDYAEPLKGKVSTETIQGTRNADGSCTFTGRDEVSEGTQGAIFQSREIASNQDECLLVMESGEATDSFAKQMRAELASNEPAARTSTFAQITLPSALAASSTKRAYSSVHYNDFVGLVLNDSTARVEWSYNGSCVTSSWNHGAHYTWLTSTGWSKQSSSISSSRTCSQAYTRAVAQFKNSSFCPSGTSYTKYNPNFIAGQENGTYTRSWTALKWGGCTSLMFVGSGHGYY